MKKRIFILLGILIIGAAAAGVCWKMGIIGQQESSAGSAFVSKVSDITGEVSGVTNRYAGVVEPQETVEVQLESSRTVKEVQVKVGEQVKEGQLLFEYDLSSIEEDLEEAQLDYDRLVNEAASLNEQISTLEKEKAKADKDNQLSYTIEIETNRMNLKKNEYNQKSKQAEITKLQSAMENTEVRSSIDGVIQKIDTSQMKTDDSDGELSETDTSYSDTSDESSSAFITILSTGAYRIKGTVNELNADNIVEGDPVIIRSRVDADQTWSGTMGSIDRDNATTNSSDSRYSYSDSSGDSQTSSSTYPFYVELDSSDGLMLGQHVYIEPDEGQETQKSGLWLSEDYIEDVDTGKPYVWARDDENKLEKRSVVLGQYDEDLCEYEIADGLSKDDYIAWPSDLLEVGMSTTTDSSEAIDMQSADSDSSQSSDSSEGFVEESIPVDDDAMESELGAEAVSDSELSDFSIEDTGEILDSSEWSDVSVESDSSDSFSSEDFADITSDGIPAE